MNEAVNFNYEIFKIRNEYNILKIYEGYYLQRDLFNKILLLKKGSLLTASCIQNIIKYSDKIPYIYVSKTEPQITFELNTFNENKKINDFIEERIAILFNNPESFLKTKNEIDSAISDVVNSILDTTLKIPDLEKSLDLIMSSGANTVSHLVNTSIISTYVGLKNNFDFEMLKTIASGSFLHDIGKYFIYKKYPKLADDTYNYTKNDILLMQEHCSVGYDFLNKYTNFSNAVKKPALFHHIWEKPKESYNIKHGLFKNYPLTYTEAVNNNKIYDLKAEDKGFYTNIIQAADVFESMVSNNYSGIHTNKDSLQYIQSMIGIQFGKDAELLLRSMSFYSIGEVITLSNNELAIIKSLSSKNMAKPIVEILTGPKRHEIIDLSKLQGDELYIVD